MSEKAANDPKICEISVKSVEQKDFGKWRWTFVQENMNLILSIKSDASRSANAIHMMARLSRWRKAQPQVKGHLEILELAIAANLVMIAPFMVVFISSYPSESNCNSFMMNSVSDAKTTFSGWFWLRIQLFHKYWIARRGIWLSRGWSTLLQSRLSRLPQELQGEIHRHVARVS